MPDPAYAVAITLFKPKDSGGGITLNNIFSIAKLDLIYYILISISV